MARTPAARSVIEQCWTLIGRRQGPFWYARRRRPAKGRADRVEFDAAWVLRREEDRGDVVGFYHTHPHGPAVPSQRDLRTMRAWASALGKPLLCLIQTPAAIAAYRFDDDDSSGEELPACELFPRGIVIVLDDQQETPDDDAEVPS